MEPSSSGLRIPTRDVLYLGQNNISLTALNGVAFLLMKVLTKRVPMAHTVNPKGKAVTENMRRS